MKEKDVITGYVLTDAERAAQKYIAPFGIGLMAIFACILWIEAVKSGGSIVHYLFACCLSAPTIFLVINSFRMRSIVELMFCVDAKTVSNFSKGKKTSLHHFQTQFITVLTRDFAYGKATVTKKILFIFSAPHCTSIYSWSRIVSAQKNKRSKHYHHPSKPVHRSMGHG